MLKCPRCGAGLSRERAQLRPTVARENVQAMADFFPFTATERSIALLAVEGFTYKEIAKQRGGTEQVVKNYMSSIFDITGASTRPELQALFTMGTVPEKKFERSEIHLRRHGHHR
jgi:DNA-binding CsgD family transcriptional regulator